MQAPAGYTAVPAPAMAQPTPSAPDWSDAELANPFRGGLGAMAGRSLDYGKGELEGVGEGVKGMAMGALNVGGDLAKVLLDSANPNVDKPDVGPLWRDVQGMGSAMAATAKAPFHWQTYADPKQFGNEVFNLATMMKTSDAARETGQATLTPTDKLEALSAQRLMEGQMEVKGIWDKAVKKYENIVGSMPRAIEAADTAKPAPMDATPIANEIQNGLNKANPKLHASMTAVNKAAAVAQQAAQNRLTWAELKQLRTTLGEYGASTQDATERGIIGSARQVATDMLHQRAKDLGLGDAFKDYNKHWSSVQDMKDELPWMGKNAIYPKPNEFFNKANPKGNAVLRNALNTFDKMDEMDPQGAGDMIRQRLKDAKALMPVLETGSGKNLMGRMSAAFKHPLYGGVPGLVVGSLTPGGFWGHMMGGMAAATLGANLADRIETIRALRSTDFPEGAAAVGEGQGGMIQPIKSAQAGAAASRFSLFKPKWQQVMEADEARLRQGTRASIDALDEAKQREKLINTPPGRAGKFPHEE